MSAPLPPVPPVVHAPARPGDSAVVASAAATPVGDSPLVGAAPGGGSTGATVTAVVGGAPAPGDTPVGTPGSPVTTTTTGAGRPPAAPEGGLARTGADVALVLAFALIAVLLGALLVRLGSSQVRPVNAR